MAQSPPLATPRMVIVPFAADHLTDRYVSWLKDPEVVRYSDQRHRTHTLESCREYWESYTGTPHYFWALLCRESQLGHVGNMNAYVDEIHSVADLGILIGEKQIWGQGYGLEAWMAVCAYLLKDAGIRKVTAGTLAVNRGMLTIMLRTGMEADGRRTRQCLFEGREVDVVHGALFRADYK
jgi:ribosomal-protein-alanine N-acetyltransferase